MTKLFRKALTLVLSLILLVSLFCMTAFAASVGASASSSSVTVGDNVTVSFTVGPDITAHRLSVSYNSSVLQFAGSSGSESFFANGADGQIVVVQSFNAPTDGTLSGSITFKAIAAGTATVSLSGSASNVAEESVSVSGSSVSITVSNPPTASSDADLSAMSISPGSLSPSFSSGTTSYSTTVSASTTQLNIYATTSDDKATVSVSDRNLKVGSNTIRVTVTAEDGTTKTYTISVTRPAGTTAPPSTGGNTGGNTSGGGNTGGNTTPTTPETDIPEAPTEAYLSIVGGGILEVSDTIDEDKIPAGFALTETVVEDFTVDAIVYSENADPAVWLIGDGNNPEGFYFIGEDGLGYPMVTLTQPAGSIIVTDIADYDVPDGYTLSKFTIGETEYDAFLKDDGKDPDHCLIYGINENGETVLYCYDPVEGTFQRYGIASVVEVKEVEVEVEVPVEVVVEVPVEVPAEPEEITLSTLLKDKLIFWSLIGIGVVILVLIILCIMLGIMYSRKSKACQLMVTKRSFNTEPLEIDE